MAEDLVQEYGGSVKAAAHNLEDLPGVGRYIAAAVRNFSLSIPEPMVDGNVVHFLNRFFGTEFTGGADDKAWSFTNDLAGPDHDPRFYWGVIDFVSSVCLHRNPRCSTCPLKAQCSYYQNR